MLWVSGVAPDAASNGPLLGFRREFVVRCWRHVVRGRRYLVCRGALVRSWSGLDFILTRLDALSVLSDQLVQDLSGGLDDLLSVLVLDVEEAADLVGLRIVELLGAAVAVADEQLDGLVFDSGKATQLTAGSLCDLSVAADAEDIDPPASELGSEPNVLPASADRLGQLVVWDDELHRVGVLVDEHPRDVGR